MQTGSSRSRRHPLEGLAWYGFFGGAAASLLLAIASVIAIDALFLGWSDFVHYLAQARTWASLWLTVWTASLSTAIAMAMGIPIGYVLSRYSIPFPRLSLTLIDLPVMVPPAAVGLFLLGLFQSYPAEN